MKSSPVYQCVEMGYPLPYPRSPSQITTISTSLKIGNNNQGSIILLGGRGGGGKLHKEKIFFVGGRETAFGNNYYRSQLKCDPPKFGFYWEYVITVGIEAMIPIVATIVFTLWTYIYVKRFLSRRHENHSYFSTSASREQLGGGGGRAGDFGVMVFDYLSLPPWSHLRGVNWSAKVDSPNAKNFLDPRK